MGAVQLLADITVESWLVNAGGTVVVEQGLCQYILPRNTTANKDSVPRLTNLVEWSDYFIIVWIWQKEL